MAGKLLSDARIRALKGTGKRYKVSDSNGLYVLVQPNGTRLWQMKYRFGGKEKVLSFGPYPEVGLTAARQARDSAREELRAGIDPSLTKKQRRAQAAMTHDHLEAVGRAWTDYMRDRWTSKHYFDVCRSLEKYAYPSLGRIRLADITTPMLLQLLQGIEGGQGCEKVHRLRQRLSALFIHGINQGLCETDPAASLKGALRPITKGQQPALTNLDDLRQCLADVEGSGSRIVTVLAHRMIALTGCRSSEVRGMRWDEIDGKVWTIPSTRMKMRRDHIVILSRQARAIVESIKPLTRRYELVFAGLNPARPLSDLTISKLLKENGYDGRHVPHGWRAGLSSVMNERRPRDRAFIDMMLAHQKKDAVEAAYNRAQYLEIREEIWQEWADLLLKDFPTPAQLMQL